MRGMRGSCFPYIITSSPYCQSQCEIEGKQKARIERMDLEGRLVVDSETWL